MQSQKSAKLMEQSLHVRVCVCVIENETMRWILERDSSDWALSLTGEQRVIFFHRNLMDLPALSDA